MPASTCRLPVLAALAVATFAPVAQASCDALAKAASSTAPDKLGETYAQLVACDQGKAGAAFDEYMRASKTVESLTAVSLAAIDGKVHQPVYPMLEQLQDFSLRDEVASSVGAQCATHPEVVTFLKGGYTALRDRQFGMWRDAYRACDSADLDTWLAEVVGTPPAITYDEKYNVVSESLVRRKRAEALPTLQAAAVAAAGNGGPFTTLLDRMNEAVKPATYGANITDEDRKKLEEALVGVASEVQPELAKQVADRLYQAGAEGAAASLLPTIYADRTQGRGTLTYGVASVESCDKEAVIHFAEVTEPGKRWSIVDDVQPLVREFKPRLKCTAEGEWPMFTTPEPLGKGGLATWTEQLQVEWAGKGLDAKLREEKAIALD